MAEYKPKKFRTQSNLEVVVRSAFVYDAAKILALASAVIGEELYQLTSSSEFKMTIQDEEKWITSHLQNPNHLVLVAEADSKIVGMLDFSNGRRSRIAHTGEFGMSVAKDYRSRGIGSLLLSGLIEWAKTNGTIEKIGLSVHGNNERAIALYKKLGFEVEGVRKRDLKYGEGQYIDTVIMGKVISEEDLT